MVLVILKCSAVVCLCNSQQYHQCHETSPSRNKSCMSVPNSSRVRVLDATDADEESPVSSFTKKPAVHSFNSDSNWRPSNTRLSDVSEFNKPKSSSSSNELYGLKEQKSTIATSSTISASTSNISSVRRVGDGTGVGSKSAGMPVSFQRHQQQQQQHRQQPTTGIFIARGGKSSSGKVKAKASITAKPHQPAFDVLNMARSRRILCDPVLLREVYNNYTFTLAR
jgi:hypothetical protein